MANGRSDRGSVKLGTPDRGKEASTRKPPGRVCDHGGCSTILSTYNESVTCSVHSEPSFHHALYRYRG